MILQKLFSNIEKFFLFSLLIFFIFGISNALKIIVLLQFVFIFFFLKFSIDLKKIFIAILSSVLLIFFSKDIDSIKIYLIFLIFLFSLNFESKKETNFSNNILYLFLFIFGLILFFKLTPHTDGHQRIYYKIEKDPIYDGSSPKLKGLNVYEIDENYIQRRNKFIRFYTKFKLTEDDIFAEDFEQDLLEIYRADYRKYKRYFSKSKNLRKNTLVNMDVFQYNQLNLTDQIHFSWSKLQPDHWLVGYCNNECKSFPHIFQNRFNFNSVDVNLSCLILLMIIALALLDTQKKKIKVCDLIYSNKFNNINGY